jgi:hypothetical protein
MNFDASEIIENSIDLDEGVNAEDISKMFELPELSEFSELGKKLLPENFLKTDSNGKINLLSLKELKVALSKGSNDLKEYFKKEIYNRFNSLKGEIKDVSSVLNLLYDTFNIEKDLQDNDNLISDLSLSNLEDMDKINGNVQILGNFKKVSAVILNKNSDLSPKQIKKLNDIDFFDEITNKTLKETMIETEKEAEKTAGQSIKDTQLDESSYLNLILNNRRREFELIVERQVYWAKGEGSISETYANRSSWSGAKLLNNYSLAVDNVNVLIGDKVLFLDESIEREGVDITNISKQAFNFFYPVIGVFFEKRDDAIKYAFDYKRYVRVLIKRP